MSRKLLVAVANGAVVGALFGAVESMTLIGRIPWWRLDLPTIPVAMATYGFVCALLTGLWGLLALRLDPKTFWTRSLAFGVLAMVYLFGGFYANHFWFPKFHTLPSLLFTGTWTLAWLLGALALLRVRGKPVSGFDSSAGGFGIGRLLVAGLAILAGLSWVGSRLGSQPHRPADPARASTSVDRPNVLLIVMDTTRADHLSCYGYPRKITPNLDGLAQEGVLFEQASSASPWTFPSHASLFTGWYLAQHGANWSYPRLDDQLTTLAEVLHDQGYQTVGFSNNPWVSRATNLHQGFDYFEESWRGGRLINRLAMTRMAHKLADLAMRTGDHDADLTNQDIRRWFEDAYVPDRPFFLFINYIEPHFRYEPPEPYRSRFLRQPARLVPQAMRLGEQYRFVAPAQFDARSSEILTDLYDGEIAYLDMRIGQLLEDLRARQLLDRTVVVVTADHGENLGEHALFGHQYCVYETLLRVPLIIRYPVVFPGGTRVTAPISLVDIMPTLLKLLALDVPTPQAALPGKSLVGSSLAVPHDRAILAEYSAPLRRLMRAKQRAEAIVDERYFTRGFSSLRKGPFKFILASDGQHELYDLRSDPGETENAMNRFPEEAKTMEVELRQLLGTLQPLGGSAQAPELDEATLGELRALGYLQ